LRGATHVNGWLAVLLLFGCDHDTCWLRSVARWRSEVKKNVKLWLTMGAHGAPASQTRKFLDGDF
jgi:hypothetical protein